MMLPLQMKFFQSSVNLRCFSFFLGALALLCLLPPSLPAQQQFQGTCARVKLKISQELTLERIGFEAAVEITNNDGTDPLTDFYAELTFSDPQKTEDEEGRDTSDLFFVQQPTLESVNRIDGNGAIGATKTAIIRWFIIPAPEAGGKDPAGQVYEIGARLSAKFQGEDLPSENLLVIPDTITVKPEPLLKITYFQPRDVAGDDPFTDPVESPVPFVLGVLVENEGFGEANDLQIKSAQPEIVSSDRGLVLAAKLLGVRIQDSPLNRKSLNVNFGDLAPGETKKGAWDMIVSISGEFIEFNASYSHAPELGGEKTSIIESVDAHFIVREALNDSPGRDDIKDFLADTTEDDSRIPDTLFESEGNELPVNHLENTTVNPFTDSRTFSVTVQADKSGWGYVQVEDPGQARRPIESVVRSDGRVLDPANAWTSFRFRDPDNKRLNFLHIFDKFDLQTYNYTVTYAQPEPDNTPPETELLFTGEVAESGGKFVVNRETQLFFQSEDESPVAIEYRLNGGDFLPAIPFTLSTPGEYLLEYFATDDAGNVEPLKSATVVLPGSGPRIDELRTRSDNIVLTGDTLSIRPGAAAIEADIPPSESPLTTDVSVFEGVKAFPVVSNRPVSPTPRTEASLEVSGQEVDFYRYRLNGGAWSGMRSAGTPIELSALSSGTQTVEVQGRSQYGTFGDGSPSAEVSWVVEPGAPEWTLDNGPADTTLTNGFTIGVSGPDLELYRWTIDEGFFRAETAPSDPIVLENLEPGEHTLELLGKRTGDVDFPPLDETQSFTFTVEPDYGTDFADRRQVLASFFPDSEGTTVDFSWDGTDGSGATQNPGWYTLLIKLDDGLGNLAFDTRLVRIANISGEPAELAARERAPINPHARGDWIVWQESQEAGFNIAARRLSEPGTNPTAVTSGSLAQESPHTDGRYAVWQGRRMDGNQDIRMVDLTNPGSIVEVTQTADTNEINPAIDYPWVIFQTKAVANPGDPWQIRARNLETGDDFLVLPGIGDQQFPSVHARRVVWQDDRHPSPEIYFANLATGATRRLTDNAFGQFRPKIRGNWIAWQDNRNTQVDIFGYDLLAKREVQLTDTPQNEARPYLEHGWMLYEDDVFDSNTPNFRILELATLRGAPLTRSQGAKFHGSLGAGSLVWQSGPDGQATLRSVPVPALQPVFQNNNAIAVTQGMADRFGSAFELLAAWHKAAGIESVKRYTALAPDLIAETATINAGQPSGTDFPLNPNEFLWVRFSGEEVLDLGIPPDSSVDLQAGLNAFAYDRFPFGYTAHRLIEQIGADDVAAVRVLDAESGLWRSVPVAADGTLQGPDFRIDRVATVLVNMRKPVSGFTP